MHTWKILKIYDYSRTKTAAILIYSFYFRSCATTSPHENRNYPFCSTCLFFKIYDFGYQTLFSGI